MLFELSGVLPAGAVFPYDFGFIPQTRGGDGDPLDVLILMDEPAFTGCLVETRLLGVIEADQTENGETTRTDRLIAVAANSRTNEHLKTLGDPNENMVRRNRALHRLLQRGQREAVQAARPLRS
ncbi:MAG: inorganic diphosphatase [Verrucomicrobiota bacterium]|nr:inorganic diphosphatase [Verrucomicrobiota bacterium]